MWRISLLGLLIWVAGTITIRIWGQYFLQPQLTARTLTLYAASFVAMALLIPLMLRLLGVEESSWPRGACLLILPTLILDPFSCLFFASAFPNVDPAAAGAFGGWMLICCGGAVVAVLVRSLRRVERGA